MYTRFEIEGFRCLKKVGVDLTPLHAFVGPNDTGKTSLLEAFGKALRSVDGLHDWTEGAVRIALQHDAGWRYEVWSASGKQQERFVEDGGREHTARMLTWKVGESSSGHREAPDFAGRPGIPVRRSALLRLDPDAMREPSVLVATGRSPTLGPRGQGLAGVLDWIRDKDEEGWLQIRQELRALFPAVKTLSLEAIGDGRKEIGVLLHDGTRVGATALSEGLLYFLAFSSMAFTSGQPGFVWLVEEPENGLHPARIREVVRVLRGLTRVGHQVLLATHSPLVINELEPDEVTILARGPVLGTRATRMDHTLRFDERAKVLSLGELWLSYCDGDQESELVAPEEPSPPIAADGASRP